MYSNGPDILYPPLRLHCVFKDIHLWKHSVFIVHTYENVPNTHFFFKWIRALSPCAYIKFEFEFEFESESES